MKRIIIAVVAIVTCLGASAKPLSPETTRKAAANFWNSHRPSTMQAIDEGKMNRADYAELPHLHIYTVGTQGFVIMSADDNVRPVLAYSYDDQFPTDGLNAELKYWLNGYEGQIAEAAQANAEGEGYKSEEWEELLTSTVPEIPISLTVVPAMLTCRWDQGNPFNLMCPFDEEANERTVVGCVATAMAQIMHYWQYPTFGRDSKTFFAWRYDTLSVNFGQSTYIWDYMPEEMLFSTNQRNKNAVSLLSYHCGVSVEMQYGIASTGGSGAYVVEEWPGAPCSQTAFRDYFKYSSDIHGERRGHYEDSTWIEMIDANLELGRPMLYSGYDDDGGHAFVLDGGDAEGLYHFNWGWSGVGNGFYSIDNLHPDASGIGTNLSSTFNHGQQCLFDIYPGEEEVFDTVDIDYEVCNNTSTFNFYEHLLPVRKDTLYLTHVDTVYHVAISVVEKRFVYFDPNMSGGEYKKETYCPLSGIVMPECMFTNGNMVFKGWCTKQNGNDSIYHPGDIAYMKRNIFFYAIWVDPSELAGIDEVEEREAIAVWPNPTTTMVRLTASTNVQQVRLFDITGRELTTTVVKGEGREVEIDLSQMRNGVYCIQVRMENGVYNKRVIKE